MGNMSYEDAIENKGRDMKTAKHCLFFLTCKLDSCEDCDAYDCGEDPNDQMFQD